jgi:hypothetical protein
MHEQAARMLASVIKTDTENCNVSARKRVHPKSNVDRNEGAGLLVVALLIWPLSLSSWRRLLTAAFGTQERSI